MGHGDEANLSRLEMSAHTGTHVDAPLHFFPNGRSLDTMPLSATVGPARVIEIHDPERIAADALAPHDIRQGERLLFKTRNSANDWSREAFRKDFVYLSTDAAEFLAECKVATVGIDYLSVAGYRKNESAVHRALLGAGIWIIEGLYLGEAEPGVYELICLPLRIADSDGAPARAALRPLQAESD